MWAPRELCAYCCRYMPLCMLWFWGLKECSRLWLACSGFGGLTRFRARFGCAGDITSVDASLLRTLVDDGYIPVVASVAADHAGQALNVNADIAAGEVSHTRDMYLQTSTVHWTNQKSAWAGC